ncbi:MAG: methyltransferase domain-containing protein [Desulfobacter sp.]|nr:MAG: methyltransferase domain-containing protein [Desulfobacter sp.]
MKLHLGCGKRFIPGFVNIDICPQESLDVQHRIETLPFNDASVSLIYASHVLEHFSRREFLDVLVEWRRVLAPDGILRIAVPDFRAIVTYYLKHGLGDGDTGLHGLICGGQRDQYDFHKNMFDEAYLTLVLKRAGFSKVRPWDWRATEHRDIDDYSQAYLPHLDKENGLHMSLNIEAVK